MIRTIRQSVIPVSFFALLIFASATSAQNKIASPDDSKFLPTNENRKEHNEKNIKEVFSGKKKKIKEEKKFDEPNKFAEFQKMIRTREGESEPEYSPNYLMEELSKSQKQSRLYKTTDLNWVERGPGNVSGRTRGIIVDPADATNNTWFAGSVGGGIWKTTNAGLLWENKTPTLPNLATTVLAQAASNPDIIYCGTGEGFFNADAVNGSGIFKSVDHGKTWTQLTSTANLNFSNVNRIIVHPTNSNIVLACTNPGPISSTYPGGIWRSTDGGINWQRTFSSVSSRTQDLKADPLNFSIQYCAVYLDGVYKSTDGGLSWSKSSNGLVTSGRIEIAVSGKNPNYIYASAEIPNGSALYVSEDKALTWFLVNSSDGAVKNWFDEGYGAQGWYDNTIAVHPYNEKIVFFGGINIWKAQITGSGNKKELLGIDYTNTNSFLSFIQWAGQYAASGIGRGVDFFNFVPLANLNFNLTDNDYVAVELQFGPGKSQKAHRFIKVGTGDTQTYQYKDYVTVPFVAWDKTNNKQIMISFRDWSNNGVFDLVPEDWSDPENTKSYPNLGREYISVHAVDYNASSPDPNIAKDNGIVYKNIWSMWPILASGAVWNANNLPASTLSIKYGDVQTRIANYSRVTDGYGQYGLGTSARIHVDQHNIVPIPVNPSTETFWILSGNDGGVAISKDGGITWREALNGGYNTTQFYGVDKKPGANEYVGGTQDNGTWISLKGENASLISAYTNVIGGDGFDVAWHYKDPNKIIGGSQYNNFARTTNGGSNWFSAIKNLDDVGSGKGAFISKIAKSNSDPDVIFTTGSQGVWRSEDFGGTWEKSSITTSDWSYSPTSTPVAISIADPQIVWAGGYFSNTLSRLFISTDGGITFASINPYSGTSLGSITGIDTHPTDMNTAYVTFSFSGAPKILRTTDLGKTWEDISGFGSGSTSSNGFPNVATYCVAAFPNTSIIWAGTEIGLFESTDNGATWHSANNGLPAVCIWDMKIVDDQVVLATHGRGIWSVVHPNLNNYQPPVVTLSPIITALSQGVDKAVNLTAKLRSGYDSTLVMIDGQKLVKLIATAAKDTSFKFIPTTFGKKNIQLIAYKSVRRYMSSSRTLDVYNLKPTQVIYSNTFDEAGDDFAGNGFTLSTPAGFNSQAVNSHHPYVESTDYYYNLLVPIKITWSPNLANIEYDDVALVEPGDDGSNFGDYNFWDYVAVEGSKDGFNWIPIEDGYDCRFNSTWENLFKTNTDPGASNYVKHKINLLNKFKPGDVIFIRFHLYSDEAVVGWGWAFDNLKIQDGASAVEKENTIPTVYSLSQNYPNPFNPETTIKFTLPQRSKVKLEIFDALGRVVSTLVNSDLDAGSYRYNWNASKFASGVYFYRLTANDFSSSKKLILMK